MNLIYGICGALRLAEGKVRPKTAAVILAGGQGTRMANPDGKPKQLMLLCGIPVIVRSAMAFEKCPYIDEIVVVSRKQDAEDVRLLMAEYHIKKFTRVVGGGQDRQESARFGLEAVSPGMKYIAVHDAARCLV
ncbi:MAG: 2-C-methyl-D-erythritol 4-phosphate cytidylyltransferase, partial [Clostridia bacterium]|nr:2-C-methyl-D-erythritol 4-phosphate cytidylyltransferase [Clostridia bacterium]